MNAHARYCTNVISLLIISDDKINYINITKTNNSCKRKVLIYQILHLLVYIIKS